MKLQQLQYVHEIINQNLNISLAAQKLNASQPSLSKQVRLLETELGIDIFARKGKHLTHITPAGQAILAEIEKVLTHTESIKRVAHEFNDSNNGVLNLATTHTQARYALPPVIKQFIQDYPDVSLHMHQGTPSQISEMAVNGKVDFAIATEGTKYFNQLITLPCYHWNRSIIVCKDHPFAKQTKKLQLAELAKYPIITYIFGFNSQSSLDEAFKQQQLQPKVVFTAVDSDIIKTYVRLGLGIGIIASMAWDPAQDKDLIALDASHLFAASTTKIAFSRNSFIRSYMYDFIKLFAPHLTPDLINKACACKTKKSLEQLFSRLELPIL